MKRDNFDGLVQDCGLHTLELLQSCTEDLKKDDINGLVQDGGISVANTLEIPHFCTKSSMWYKYNCPKIAARVIMPN